MKKKEEKGFEELLAKIAADLDFDYYEVKGKQGRYVIRFGYDNHGTLYGLDIEARVTGPTMFRFVVDRLIRHLAKDMGRK